MQLNRNHPSIHSIDYILISNCKERETNNRVKVLMIMCLICCSLILMVYFDITLKKKQMIEVYKT